MPEGPEVRRVADRLFRESDIEVLDDDGLARHPFLSRAGPDLLGGSFAGRDVAERLRSPRFQGRALEALYLDQRLSAPNANLDPTGARRIDPGQDGRRCASAA